MGYRVVTVFGGAGCLGRAIVAVLARSGAHVRVACRRPEEASRCKPMGDVGQVVPVAANIRDNASVLEAVDGADAVVNAVGILYARGKQTFDAIHREGAQLIAKNAAACHVKRLIHISAIGADMQAGAAYARTKGEGEQAVKEFFPGVTVLRPSVLFGPDDDFFNKFAAMARIAPALPLIGGGHTQFQPAYINDVADAVLSALANQETVGKTYELGGPRTYSFRNLLELLLSMVERERLLIPVPFWVATMQGYILERLPFPILTRDQVQLLRSDNVVSEGAAGFTDLGIIPTAAEVILPTYLSRYRRGGQKNS